MFELDSRLNNDTHFVADLPLCRLLLMNDRQFPWLILVPRVEQAREIYLLTAGQQHQYLTESAITCRALEQLYRPDKLNVAALGNVVAQLHIHHVARFSTDSAWPAPVWGKQPALAYSQSEANKMINDLRDFLTMQEQSYDLNHHTDH